MACTLSGGEGGAGSQNGLTLQTGRLSSPHLVRKAWGIPQESLVFISCGKAEEPGVLNASWDGHRGETVRVVTATGKAQQQAGTRAESPSFPLGFRRFCCCWMALPTFRMGIPISVSV